VTSLDDRYPTLSAWVRHQGWIEIGHDEYSTSFIRVLDPGGMVWEGAPAYGAIDEALAAAEEGIRRFMRRQGMLPFS
jgi:hypothetical protein